MSEALCPHCQNTEFELRQEKVTGATAPLMLLRCSACAAPVGVVPPVDRLNELAEMLSRLEARLDRMLKTLA